MNESTIAISRASAAQSLAKEELLAKLLDDYLSGLESGKPLDLDRMIEEHPDLAADIRAFTDGLDVLHQLTRRFRNDQAEASEATQSKRLGDFEIGPEVGRGGMGVVYEAQQISLDRKVALKVLPFAAVWDEKQVARFRNEARAAAQLHHPNIVPVFAVGEERGVHFYAMQFIEGRSLEDVVDELQRDSKRKEPAATSGVPPEVDAAAETTKRAASATKGFSQQFSSNRTDYARAIARLGIQAAEALHHAHEYGVLHRDIKPSNLLIDHTGKLWVTDFGLARIQNSPGVTVTGDVVGTLRYMSPEQAAGQHALVDTRSDVYSLGATLYEMLTLRPAFEGEDRHEVLRAIGTQEPPAPRSIDPAIPIDLETIVLQAMSKSHDKRYATAAELAEDLERFLEGRPTLARRPTAVDRVSKWLHRHRFVAASAVVVLLLLSTISTVGAVLLAREKSQKETALLKLEDSLAQEQANLEQARQVVDRFGIQLADQLQGTPGTERLRQQLLLETLNYYRGFLNQLGPEAGLQEQVAMAHLKAGVVTAKLGATKKAIEEYRTAQGVLMELIEEDPTNVELQSQLALSRNNLALLLARHDQPQVALQEYEQAIDAQRHLVATNPDNETYAGHLAESHVNRGTLLGQLGEAEAAIQSLTHAVTILHDSRDAAPENPQHAHDLAIAYNNLSFVQRSADSTLAEQSAMRAVEILEELVATSNSEDSQADLALCYCNLAAIQAAAERVDVAMESYRRAIDLRESLMRKSPQVVQHRSELGASLNNLALLEISTGDIASAVQSFRLANRLFASLLADFPEEVAYASGWAALLNNQALSLANIDRHDEAITAFDRAIEVQTNIIDHSGPTDQSEQALSRMYFNAGQSLQSLGRWDKALEYALARRELWQGDGERLFGVAVELASIVQGSRDAGTNLEVTAILETLQQLLETGWKPATDLAADPRFAMLQELPGFAELAGQTGPEDASKGNVETEVKD